MILNFNHHSSVITLNTLIIELIRDEDDGNKGDKSILRQEPNSNQCFVYIFNHKHCTFLSRPFIITTYERPFTNP